MQNRIAEFTRSLRELGEVQVNDLDFMEFLNTNIEDLEIGHSLRKLGNRKVSDWEFKSALPAVQKLAQKEVDLVDLMKRAAHYKVMDWDFRNVDHPRPSEPADPTPNLPGPGEMAELSERLRNYLQYVVVNLIDEPESLQIRIRETRPGVLYCKLLVAQKDVKDLIGRNGQSASAIRSLLKARATALGAKASLQILSHEEELAQASGQG